MRVPDAGRLLLAVLISAPAGSPYFLIASGSQAVDPVRVGASFSDANWISMNPRLPGADNEVSAAVVDGAGNLYIGGVITLAGDPFTGKYQIRSGTGAAGRRWVQE